MESDPGEAHPQALEEPQTRRRFERADWYALVVIGTGATVLMLPVFLRGFPDGFDIGHHYRWSYYFCAELKEGSLYPRWLAGANRGFGSPTLFYYPPLSLYSIAAFNFLARNLLFAIKLSCWLSMMLSGVAMYAFSRSIASRGTGLLVAVLYMAAPYHIFDLYKVNALAEYWAFVWVPLLLMTARQVFFFSSRRRHTRCLSDWSSDVCSSD